MSEPSPGAVLRQIQQAQANLRKVRQALVLARSGDADPQAILAVGWEGLARAHRVLAEIPLSAANDAVMSKQIALQRYATALLVRLRRLSRKGLAALEGEDEDLDNDDF